MFKSINTKRKKFFHSTFLGNLNRKTTYTGEEELIKSQITLRKKVEIRDVELFKSIEEKIMFFAIFQFKSTEALIYHSY